MPSILAWGTIASIVVLNICSAFFIPLGGMFESSNRNEELAFELAIERVNKQQHSKYILKPISKRINPDEVIDAKRGVVVDTTLNKPFVALQTTCSILKEGVATVFDLLSAENSNAVQSLCDAKEIPVIQTTLNTQQERECCSINLFPRAPTLAGAFVDLLNYWKWTSFTILYESPHSLPMIAELLKTYHVKNGNVVVRQLYLSENGDYLEALKEIRKSGQTKFVLDCQNEHLDDVLKQALQVGLMMGDYSYIIINLDFHTTDLKIYQHSETNITSFRLFDPSEPNVIEVVKELKKRRKQLRSSIKASYGYSPSSSLQTSTVLLFDAIKLLVEILNDYGDFIVKPLFCNITDSWEHGSTIFNFMKTKTIKGLTGTIEFDYKGHRTDFSLDVVRLSENGIETIGSWNSRNGLSMLEMHQLSDSLINTTFTVMIAINYPYAMYKPATSRLTGNDRYEGFAIDLIHELAQVEGFNYIFLQNKEDKNGAYNATSEKWNGLMGDVLDGTGDLAISDLTITREREKFVDFTSPFMSLGVQILYTKPKQSLPGFFSFAQPFAPEVWLLIGITFIIMTVSFYIIGRFCPIEWYNPFPCIEKPKYLTNQYNIQNCLWLTTANLMLMGADIAPRGISTRVLSRFWSFFILIMLSTYTANMAAFLTTEKDIWAFTDIKELIARADKLGITYGAVEGGATYKLFQESQDQTYRKVGAYMNAHPEYMVPWYEDGIEWVLDETKNYAFFMESSTIKYVIERKCNLTAVGYLLDQKYYGIAMRKNSTYRNRLSAAVLKLSETGVIDKLERKWWQEQYGGGECNKPTFKTAPPLSFKHISGVIWITLGGVAAASLLVIVEFAVHFVRKIGRNPERLKLFKQEMKFYFKFEEMMKPSRPKINLPKETINENS